MTDECYTENELDNAKRSRTMDRKGGVEHGEKGEGVKMRETDILRLEIGYGLIPAVDEKLKFNLPAGIIKTRTEIAEETGIKFPAIHILDNLRLNEYEYCLKIKDIVFGKYIIPKEDVANAASIITVHLRTVIKRHLNYITAESDSTAEFYCTHGYDYAAKGEYDLAIADYTEAITGYPNFAKTYIKCGNAYTKMGDYDHAIADYTKVIELTPKEAAAYSNRGDLYSKKGDYDKAIEDCSKAISIGPSLADAYNNRGEAYNNKDDIDRAIEDFTRAISLDPNYVNAQQNLEGCQEET